MKNFLVSLFTTTLLLLVSACPSVATSFSRQTTRITTVDGPLKTVQDAYDYAINVVGTDPQTAIRVILYSETVMAPQRYLHDVLASLGYEFPVPLPIGQ